MSGVSRAAVLLGACALLAATPAASAPATSPRCGGSVASPQTIAHPGAALAWRALLTGPVAVRRAPPAGRPASASASGRAPDSAGARRRVSPRQARALLVLAARRDARGRCWLRVRLPSRPNSAAGWLRAAAVVPQPTPWRLSVSRARRAVSVYRSGQLVRRLPAVVGKPSTPTPAGLFAVAGVWRGAPWEFSGSWILGLSAHSPVLRSFEGGNGRVAIHGRGGTSLRDPLGTARSHGCIRLANPAIDWLVRSIGAGALPGLPVGVS
ncbi:MAG TPA: L,D-transpeptidase [Solirubrobacterales bacterium]|nr:L,D-transpeptidase [Solirubrobacterales bacterium]